MTPREPNRFEEKARELWRSLVMIEARAVPRIAAALRRERDDALELAARGCESMVIGGRAWTEEQAVAAKALFAAAEGIRALIAAPFPEAPPANPHGVHCRSRRGGACDCSEPPLPVAPSLLPRVLAALELAYSGDLMTMGLYGQYYALAAELRRYIADQPAAGASEESPK